jgi:hypothetical protein
MCTKFAKAELVYMVGIGLFFFLQIGKSSDFQLRETEYIYRVIKSQNQSAPKLSSPQEAKPVVISSGIGHYRPTLHQQVQYPLSAIQFVSSLTSSD